ncbi:MAG: chromosome segregation SMC family protein [Nanoarchaeota archaeon]
MVHIKRMVMHGFKSFARRTEIVFDTGINVILGPNGSGKSNVSDALCFVLGRLSIKSMRAAKAKNLLFMGSKYIKPAREAMVELVFDNSDRGFNIDNDEISLKRIVKYNGQGVYRINEETKTRIEVIETLAQAGIDPYGFNLVLQGQIQSIVKMHPEDRRKIIEEVAGIAIYELRKEKSLKELEKTEGKLKEIGTVLRERTAYLRNLDRERQEALKFKELENNLKRINASILARKANEKDKEIESIVKSIGEKDKQKEKFKEEARNASDEQEKLNERINEITKHIQRSSGIEQEKLNDDIANLKAELEGLRVRRENYENRKREVDRRVTEMEKSIPEFEKEIQELKEESPKMAEKSEELKKKKDELNGIKEEREKVHSLKNELVGVREVIKERERQLARNTGESENMLRQIESFEKGLSHKSSEECSKIIKELRNELEDTRHTIEQRQSSIMNHEKSASVAESELEKAKKIKSRINEIDTCPMCLSKMTSEHISHVNIEQEKIIGNSEKVIDNSNKELEKLKRECENLKKRIDGIDENISNSELEKMRHDSIRDKKDQLRKLVENENILRQELRNLEESGRKLEEKTQEMYGLEEKYEAKMLEIEEISSRTSGDVETSLLYKQRDLEKVLSIVKNGKRDLKDLENSINELARSFDEKNEQLARKDLQEKEFQKKFKELFEEREKVQHEIQEINFRLSELNSEIRAVEDQINYLKVGKAKLDAEKEAIGMDLSDYAGIELMQGSMNYFEERLVKTQEALQKIGSINLRALEVYEDMKKEYDSVQEKVNTLENEKNEILKIIEEIDKKKKRSFMKTFNAMSELFSQNFAQLYTKGVAYLELENKEDIFAGGVNIVVRLAKGKYFDVTSLSGGEQTLVALSLLFAIQEYKPYHFYVFDEIDAALDKRNSERLGALLKKYMKAGQYIVITHNDAIIMNSQVLYGVSMHDNVSKILSLDLSQARDIEKEIEKVALQSPTENTENKKEDLNPS